MTRPSPWRWPVLLMLCAPLACDPGEGPPVPDEEDASPERDTFEWEPVVIDGLTPSWGSVLAAGEVGGVRVGGVLGSEGPVTAGLVELARGDELEVTPLSTVGPARFCGCAMLDDNRGEVVAFGGRDGMYVEQSDGRVVDLASGESSAIIGTELPAPVGCSAVFFPALDRGYVFGGASRADGFSDVTLRWDPDERTLTRVDTAGPAARYDAAFKRASEDTAILVGGMGASPSLTFYSDVWRFDAGREEWSQVTTTSVAPAGRRVPWLALAPDGDTMLFGFGAAAADGSSTLADLWRLSFQTGEWEELEVELPSDVEAPFARGFTPWLPGPPGSAGLLSGGYSGVELVPDAYVLWAPDDAAGDWR